MSTPNPSYKPSEGKREEFRKYLEKNGVMDALTKVLVNLYEEVEKPEDALEYIREKLAVLAGIETYKQLQQKLIESEEKIKDLESQLEASNLAAGAVQGSSTEQPTEEQPPTESNENEPTDQAPAPALEENPEAEQ